MNVFARIFETVHSITQNNLQNAKNKTLHALKPLTKPQNERFRLYHVKGTLDRLKITSKMLKIKHYMP